LDMSTNTQTTERAIKPIEVPSEAREVKIALCEMIALSQDIANTRVSFIEMRPGEPPQPQEFGVNSVVDAADILRILATFDRDCDGGGGRVTRAMKKWADKVDQNGGTSSRNGNYGGGGGNNSSGFSGGDIGI